jgi:hypothetical protein
MPEALDDIDTGEGPAKPAAAPKAPGWGGRRAGSGRKGTKSRASTREPRASAPDPEVIVDEEADPRVDSFFKEFGGDLGKPDAALAGIAYGSVLMIDPTRPPGPTEHKAMHLSATLLADKYLGDASKMLSIEALFLLVWIGILGHRYATRDLDAIKAALRNANPTGADRGPVGNGEDDSSPASRFTDELSALAGAGSGS